MLTFLLPLALAPNVEVKLPAGPGPVTNPLKGYAPYEHDGGLEGFPSTMIFFETSWRELEPEKGKFAFDKWEAATWKAKKYDRTRSVLRVWLDYPTRPIGLPQWLLDSGVKLTTYDQWGGGKSPNYSDPKLRAALQDLIVAMGKRWNNDPQVAYIQVGLLGHWGEWHTYPKDELFASDTVQREVIDGMRKAFPDKHLMARNAVNYPGEQAWLGFHDDMIPQDTVGPDEWMFLPTMKRAKRDQNWKVAPTGGEMVPGAAVQYLGKEWDLTQRAVREAHFTWIGPYCPTMATSKDPSYRKNAEELSRMMGYQFRLTRLQVRGRQVTLSGINEGVAPFYYRWPLRFALLDPKGKPVATSDSKSDITQWVPGSFTVKATLPKPPKPGKYRLAVGLIDPWLAEPTVKFANRLPLESGWTILSSIAL